MATTPRQLALELRAQREFDGWTRAELAARAGVSVDTFNPSIICRIPQICGGLTRVTTSSVGSEHAF